MKKIAIIGAGLSSLSLAHLIKDHAQVTLFEKARGVSGRMSTRRAEPWFFDHGAQYFTVRTQAFEDFIQPLLDQGVIERWNARYAKLDGPRIIEQKNWRDEAPRYVGVPGMSAIAKHLAAPFTVHLNTRVVSMEHKDSWTLTDAEGQRHDEFDWVVCTAPSPQAVDLLPESFQYHSALQAMDMRGCFSLMLGFERSLPLAFEAAHVENADLSWIGVNRHKPGRNGSFTLMVHSSSEYADSHMDDDRESVIQHLIAETSRVVGLDVSLADYQALHGWRYAKSAKRDRGAVFLDRDHQLAACGDWCVGDRVEDAFTSAHNLANAMKESVL